LSDEKLRSETGNKTKSSVPSDCQTEYWITDQQAIRLID